MKTTTSTATTTPGILLQNNEAIYNSGLPSGSPFGKLFMDLLQDIYWAEQQFTGALHRMYEAATTGLLRRTFKDIQHITLQNVARLEKVFTLLGKTPEAKESDTIQLLVRDTERAIKETPEHSILRDTELIRSAQKIENYEIETYNNLLHTALALGHNEAAYILESILRDEEHTDMKLAEIAENGVHPLANNDSSDD